MTGPVSSQTYTFLSELIKSARRYERAKSLAVAASEFLLAGNRFDRNNAEKYFLTYNPPWLFIAVCFFIATLGASLSVREHLSNTRLVRSARPSAAFPCRPA